MSAAQIESKILSLNYNQQIIYKSCPDSPSVNQLRRIMDIVHSDYQSKYLAKCVPTLLDLFDKLRDMYKGSSSYTFFNYAKSSDSKAEVSGYDYQRDFYKKSLKAIRSTQGCINGQIN